jgi:hypothetical protein
MKTQSGMVITFVAASCLGLHPLSLVRADGGAVRLRQQAGAYQITVFTSPTLLCAAPVDFSVLVQDAAGECVPDARVTVRLTARASGETLDYAATAAAATNKLFKAAVFLLPEPGWWDVQVAIAGPRGPAAIQFGIQADKRPPPWLQMWPWFSWPFLVVALFSVHQVLVRRKGPV